jgi:hypothetical protein
MIHQYKKTTELIILCGILAVALVSFASATSTGTLTATSTDNSSLINLSGSGFDSTENVTLSMLNETDSTVIYTFTENATTDDDGAFSVNVTLPPGYYGTYNFTAETSSVFAYDTYTISDETALTSSPDDSNIINVVGTGFNAKENVTLTLNDTSSTAYTFPENITTDDQGKFNATVIVPTSISGDFTLIASTSTTSTNTTISVPDLSGPTGATGTTGATGATGETGEAGTPADTTVEYFALIISIAAIAVAILTIIKKH